MIRIPEYKVTQADRVYAEMIDKVAFNVPIDPAAVLGSIAGGYAANSVYNKKQEEHQQNQNAERRIENNTYSQVEAIMKDLKIVFTPINVVYSVNGQVFEIIKTDEMTPYMKQAFLQRDGNYFRDILMNKINMELQLAEQAFSQRLLAAGGYNQEAKEASFVANQEYLIKLAEDQFESLCKTASDKAGTLNIEVNFDNLRPFSSSDVFFRTSTMPKVASMFDGLFDNGISEDVGVHRLNSEVNVGFLPDRVVYTWNGQLIEQLSLLHMNEEGYEAFRRKDKPFFINVFQEHAKKVSESFGQEPAPVIPEEEAGPEINKEAGFNEESFGKLFDLLGGSKLTIDKQADSLEDIIEELVEEEFPVIERDNLNIFTDSDIHPVAYDRVLSEKYSANWARHELESIFKQIELDFNLEEGLAENPLNKISLLHAVSNPDHSMYLAPLTFEKFIRGVNSKSIVFEQFQGNLTFEEILFGLEVAKSYDGDEVFLQFHDNIAAYISEELMNDNIRFVSAQVFDESNPSEKIFFESVNGYLMRKWKEKDAQGLNEEDALDRQYTMALQIVEISDEILKSYAEQLEVDDPYTSVDTILDKYDFLSPIESDFKQGVRNTVKSNVAEHLLAALFVEYKQNELEYTFQKLEEAGVLRG